MQALITYVREHKLIVLPHCPYVLAQFRRTPDQYLDIWKRQTGRLYMAIYRVNTFYDFIDDVSGSNSNGWQALTTAPKTLILLHGRGGRASDILSIADHLTVPDFALLAPQAPDNSWYPASFLAPPAQMNPGFLLH
jgi:hypothetical protein